LRVNEKIRNYDKLIQGGPKRKTLYEELSLNRLSWRQSECWHHLPYV